MKKTLVILIIFCIVSGSFPYRTFAQTTDIQAQIEAVQKQRDELLAEQKQLQTQLDALGQQSTSLTGNIKTLNATRTKLLADLKVTQNSITAAGLQISQLGQNINANQGEIQRHESAISDALKELSSYDSHTLVFDMLTYQSIADVWTDQANLSSVQDKLDSEIANLKNETDLLAKNKAATEAQKQSLASLQSQLSGQKQVVESTQAAKQDLLTKTKSQEAAYQKMLADNLAQEKMFEDQLFKFQEQLKAAPSSAAPSAKHGLLTWPLTTIRITQQFGRTADSVRLYASGTHSGTDFGASVGTPVMAMADGVIGGLGNTDDAKGCLSYGRWLFINYNDGLSSIYGHLSAIIVKNGDTVRAGQVVAYSGGQPGIYGSGYATGPHLHVGLFNSAGVSIQQYTSSINCKSVSIPLANPSDYLDPMAYLPAF